MNKKKFILSVLVAVFLIASGLASMTLVSSNGTNIGSHVSTPSTIVVNQNSPASVSAPVAGSTTGSGSTYAGHSSVSAPTTSSLIATAQSQGVPLKYLFVPAIHNSANVRNGVVMPGYSQGPAPFGIGAYGIRNVSGTLTPYSYTTNGFQANLNLSDLSMNYLNSFDPNGMSVQLNTILTNASVRGLTNYTYWTQNVAEYDSYAHQFIMIDNIWNFSSPTAGMPAGTIYNSTAPYDESFSSAYIGVGNVVNNVSAPFNLTLTLETSVYGGMSAVYFNYSLTFTNTSTGLLNTIGGVFDRVLFNSQSGVQGYTASKPVFKVDGSQVTPLGFIPYDAEVTLEGPGGGSNANIASIAGNVTLHYNNSAGNYVNVPSAYNIGSETGETSTGIAEAWSPNGVVRLSSGPSMIYGMWNVSGHSGTTHYTGTLAPSNSFMFVAPGNSIQIGPGIAKQYGYVPMTTSGSYSFYLPTGTYYQEVMLSNYNIEQGALHATESITLTSDTSMGIYTPLYAMNNAQLANISFSGAGTIANPYVGFNNQNGYINPLFGMFSDYGFPVFSGMKIQNTNASIDFNNSASFQIMYEQNQSLLYMGALYGMGAIDYMDYALYNTSYVSIYNASIIGGTNPWAAETGIIPYTGNLIMWNSTNDLIANNTFVLGQYLPYNSAIFIYNNWNTTSNNTIVGNTFQDTWYDLGITLASSGNLIYNNVFNMNFYNVFDWSYYGDPWTGYTIPGYSDTWNVTPTATSAFYLNVNGYHLTGNILGNSTMGGNYWNTYASIAIGGDYAPIVPTGPYYPVWFTQFGLNAGQTWSVTMGGVTHSSTGATIEFMAIPNQTYNYSVQYSGNMVSFWGPTSSSMTTYPGLVTEIYYFSPVYTLTIKQTGLPNGFGWSADINDAGYSISSYTISNQLTLTYIPGEFLSYNFASGSYYGFSNSYIYSGGEYLVPLFNNEIITEQFSPIYSMVQFDVNYLPATTGWSLTLYNAYDNGTTSYFGTVTGFSESFEYGTALIVFAPLGDYYATLNAPGYTFLYYNPAYVSFTPKDPATLLTAVAAIPVTFNILGLPSGTTVTLGLYSNTNVSSYNWWQDTVTSTSSSITVMAPSSSFDLSYYASSSNSAYYSSTGIDGSYLAIIPGASSQTVDIYFYPTTPAPSTVTFHETGLDPGSTWQVTFNGIARSGTAGSPISFTVAPGIYNYQVTSAGMVTPQSSGTVNVQSSTQDVNVSFTPQTYTVTFIVAGLPANQSLNVTFNGQTQSTSGAGVVFTATAGTYSYSVGSVSGYTAAVNSSTVNVGHNTVVVLSFTPVTPTPSSPATSGLVYLGYAGLVGLGALVGVLGAVFVPKMLKGKKPEP